MTIGRRVFSARPWSSTAIPRPVCPHPNRFQTRPSADCLPPDFSEPSVKDGNTPPNKTYSNGMITRRSGSHSRWLRIRSHSASFSSLESDPLMVIPGPGCQSLRLPKNWANTANCSAISGASPHSTAISENGLDQEAGGEISEGGIPCVFLR